MIQTLEERQLAAAIKNAASDMPRMRERIATACMTALLLRRERSIGDCAKDAVFAADVLIRELGK